MIGTRPERRGCTSDRLWYAWPLRDLNVAHALVLPREEDRIVWRTALQLLESKCILVLRIILADAGIFPSYHQVERPLLVGFVRRHRLLRILYLNGIWKIVLANAWDPFIICEESLLVELERMLGAFVVLCRTRCLGMI